MNNNIGKYKGKRCSGIKFFPFENKICEGCPDCMPNKTKVQYKAKKILNKINYRIYKKKLKIIKNKYPIGQKIIYKSKYGGYLILTIKSYKRDLNIALLNVEENNYSYEPKYCTLLREEKLKRILNEGIS
jgi:hypothetical protein